MTNDKTNFMGHKKMSFFMKDNRDIRFYGTKVSTEAEVPLKVEPSSSREFDLVTFD